MSAAATDIDVKELPEFQDAATRVAEVKQAAEGLGEVTDEDTLNAAIETAAAANAALKAVKTTRLALTKPFRETTDRINTEFGELTSPIEGIESRLKSEITRFQREQREKAEAERQRQERLARERQAREDARAEREKREPVKHEPPPVPEPPKTRRTDSGAKVTMQTYWKVEIVDESKLPREYLTPDTKAIRKAVDAGAREIPGVKITPEERPRMGH